MRYNYYCAECRLVVASQFIVSFSVRFSFGV